MSVPNPTSEGTCLITGASSGIGAELAREMARRGYNVTLLARRAELLDELAAEIEREHGVEARAIGCDVTDEAGVEQVLTELAQAGKQIDVLMNNAGIGDEHKFVNVSYDRAMAEIDINVRALVSLTHRVLPAMVERGRGAILNVASTAAFQPMPGQSVYAATKAFVLAFGEGISVELRGTGVSCTTLCPGPTKTEFFDPESMERYVANSPGFVWQTPDEVAKAGVEGMFKRKRVVIPKLTNRIGALSGSFSPHFVSLEVINRFWPVGK